MAGTCGYGEELSGSINEGKFLTICKIYWLASQEGLCSMDYAVITTYKKISERDFKKKSHRLFICKSRTIYGHR